MSVRLNTENRIPTMIGLFFTGIAISAAATLAPIRTESPAAPGNFPAAIYRQYEAQGKKILRVDSSHSLVTIKVRRAGLLSLLGHDHIIASRDVAGYVSPSQGVADLYVPLGTLVVDDPGLRNAAGFDTQPSQRDIEGTRHNMLSKTLDAKHFPYALIHVARADAGHPDLKVTITLHGMTRGFEVPAQFESVPDGISVAGSMSFKQSDFGITPLSVFGGALQVQDKLDLQFHILADK